MDPHPEPDHADGVRVAARVLLVDPAGRVLLFQGFDPHDPSRSFWFTAGGGLEPGESLSAGAIRELREETGMRVRPHDLVGPVWRRRARFRFEGVAYDSDEWFFLAALSEPPRAVDTGGFTELEARTVLGHRWWSSEELRRTHETVYPAQLAELLPGVLAGAWDGHTRPID